MDPEKVWIASLKGISQDMIKHGFNKLVAKEMYWPPSAPEFASMCKITAEDLNVPELEESLRRIQKFRSMKEYKLNPFEYTLYKKLSVISYELDRMKIKEYHAKTKKIYGDLVKEIIGGVELDEQPELIEDSVRNVSNKKTAKEKLAEIREKLKTNNKEPK